MSCVPIYAAVKLRNLISISEADNTYMFFSGRFGASVPAIPDLSDGTKQEVGIYGGAGVGFNLDHWVIEAIYAVNTFKLSSSETLSKANADFQTITIYAGFRFK